MSECLGTAFNKVLYLEIYLLANCASNQLSKIIWQTHAATKG